MTDTAAEEVVHDISLAKDVLPFIIPLICILTIKNQCADIIDMLHFVNADPDLMSVFEDQSFIWWNRPDVMRFVEYITQKYIRPNPRIHDIAVQFKMSLTDLTCAMNLYEGDKLEMDVSAIFGVS